MAGNCKVSWALGLTAAVDEFCADCVAVAVKVASLDALAARAPALKVLATPEVVGEREARGLEVPDKEGLLRAVKDGVRETAGDFEGEEDWEGEGEEGRDVRGLCEMLGVVSCSGEPVAGCEGVRVGVAGALADRVAAAPPPVEGEAVPEDGAEVSGVPVAGLLGVPA